MAALRNAVNNRATVIFLIAFLIVVHLLVVHGHDEPSALEACVVLLVSIAAVLVAGALRTGRPATTSIPVAARVVVELWEAHRPSPALKGTVMRH